MLRPPSSPMRRLTRMAQPIQRRAMRVLTHDGIAPHQPLHALRGAGTGGLPAAGTRRLPKRPFTAFKGKGSLETWASQCAALRDDVLGLAQRRVLPKARAYPFSRPDGHRAPQERKGVGWG